MSVKDTPVIRKGAGRGGSSTVDSVGHMIYAHRTSRGMTQKQLAKAIGSYITQKGGTVISEWERGFTLPRFDNIFKLAEVLKVEKEPFFNAILREYYDRFVAFHHENFCKFTMEVRKNRFKGDLDYKKFEGRYYFCTKGKINYHFPEFSGIMQKCYRKKGVTYLKIAKSLKRRKYIKHTYSRGHISAVINGYKVPSLKIVVDLSEYFKLDDFKMYEIVVKEKAICHAKNMMEQWNEYKKERLNNVK